MICNIQISRFEMLDISRIPPIIILLTLEIQIKYGSSSNLKIISGDSKSIYNINLSNFSKCALFLISQNSELTSSTSVEPQYDETGGIIISSTISSSLLSPSWRHYQRRSRSCQFYILFQPLNFECLESLLEISKAGYSDTSGVLVLIASGHNFSIYTDIHKYTADIYFYLPTLMNNKYKRFIFPGKIIGGNALGKSETESLGLLNFEKFPITVNGGCWDLNYEHNICRYVVLMQNLLEEQFNFSIYRNTDGYGIEFPVVIHQASYMEHLRSINDGRSLPIVDKYKNVHGFYCKEKATLKGSHWIKWITPFDSATWIGLALLAMGYVAIAPKNQRITAALRFFKVFVKQFFYSRDPIIMAICIGLTSITLLYEGRITSQIVSPLSIDSYSTLGQLLDDGHKFYFPVSNITEFFDHYYFPEFDHGFQIRGQYYRWRSSFIAGAGRSWESMMRHNVSTIKLITDLPAEEAKRKSMQLRPHFCTILPEVFFVRIFTWRFDGRNQKAFWDFMIQSRDVGFYEYYHRRYDLWRVNMKYNDFFKQTALDKSYITLDSGIFTIFGICGALIGLALGIFLLELLMIRTRKDDHVQSYY